MEYMGLLRTIFSNCRYWLEEKKGPANETQPIDLCALAINLGCTFVARSFSGSKKQLNALLKAAMSHKGFALIDVISPCVTFNNNDESMKSYGYVKENEITLTWLITYLISTP